MIGGKVQTSDIKVEVETKRWENVAPLVYPDSTPVPGGGTHSIYYDTNWEWAGYGSGNERWHYIRAFRSVGSIDAYGNRKWTINQTMGKDCYEVLYSTEKQGVPGKYYSLEVDLRTYVSAMENNVDYVPQQPCRINLYATDGVEANDVLIAQSGYINPVPASNATWPFHPGYREWRINVNPVAAMPAGKTYFRLKAEYNTSFSAFKEIWLPASYTDINGVPYQPSNLRFFEFRWNTINTIYEHSGNAQEWAPTTAQPVRYDWVNQGMWYVGSYKGWQCTFTVDQDSRIPEMGLRVSMGHWYTETGHYVSITTSKGTFSTANMSVTAGGRRSPTFPASCFDPDAEEQEVTVYIHTRGFNNPMIHANDLDYDDFDGHTFFNYSDWTTWVTDIDINMYDTEVSTCSLVLREREGVYMEDYSSGHIDVENYFDQGKRVRITMPTFAQTYQSSIFGLNLNEHRTLFVGTIDRRTARYPKKARKEVSLLVTNGFPLLQEKTTWALAGMEDYSRIVPPLGLSLVVDWGFAPPMPRDPLVSLTGYGDVDNRWVIRDETNGFPIIDALMLTRNSQFGFIYFDKWNRLNCKTNLSPTITATFNDQPGAGEESYAKLDVNFDSDSVINSVRIREYQQVATINESTFQRNDAIVETEQVIYDTDAIRKYRKSEITFRTFKKDNYDELQYHILDKYATPKVRASNLVLPLNTPAKLTYAKDIGIYSLIAVKFENRLDETYRVNRIRHTIRPGSVWRMEIGFDVNHDGVYW